MKSDNSNNSTFAGFVRGFFALVFVVGLSWLSINQIQPPAAAPSNTSDSQYSSARALLLLKEIARRPHPTGSEDNARVRSFLKDQLSGLGFTVEEQSTVGVRPAGDRWPVGPITAATVHNVVARLKGAANTGAVMLAAHYDSVPSGPGASDDGSGVASILEVVRAIKSGPPLKNDLIVVFSDAEELGLLGAQAFSSEHPWAKDAKVVLNLEARGSRGPVFMFETSEGNGWLIDQYCLAARAPLASSLMYSLYKKLPNDTDLTVYKKFGMAGLNFAYADGLNHYHTELDNVDQIDPRSLQQEGVNALGLARQFGSLDLSHPLASGDEVYFNAPGSGMIHYGQRLVMPITLSIVLMFVAVGIIAIRKRWVSIRGILFGVAGVVLSLITSQLIIWVSFHFIRPLYFKAGSAAWGDPYNSGWMKLALVLLALGVGFLFLAVFRRFATIQELHLAAIGIWLAVLVGTSVWLPPASYLFVWPLLFAMLGFVLCARDAKGVESEEGASRLLINAVFLSPMIFLVVPVIYMLYIMLSLSIPMVQTSLAVFCLCLAVPLFADWSQTKLMATFLTLVVIVVGAVCCVTAIEGVRWTEDQKRLTNIFYTMDTDAGRASWMSIATKPDEWTSQYLTNAPRKSDVSGFIPWIRFNALSSDAPASSIPPPTVEITSDRIENGMRLATIHATSQTGAAGCMLIFDQSTSVKSANLEGHDLLDNSARLLEAGKDNGLKLYFVAPEKGSFNLNVSVPAGATISGHVEDIYYELPSFPSANNRPRPVYMMASPIPGASDSTIIRKGFGFPAKSGEN